MAKETKKRVADDAFIDRLGNACRARTKSVDDVCRHAGIRAGTVRRYRNGKEPSLAELTSIARTVPCSADELLGLAPVPGSDARGGGIPEAAGLTGEYLRKVASDMLESRVGKAFASVFPQDGALDSFIMTAVREHAQKCCENAFRKIFEDQGINVECTVNPGTGQGPTDTGCQGDGTDMHG